jgi:hypothetical protein
VPIAADGSFTSTTSQTGVVNSAAATFTYTFSGHFHGPNASGVARVAGVFREDIAYNDGTTQSCSTNDMSWIAVRDQQGAETTSPAVPGSYLGQDASQPSFSVASDGTKLQDVTVRGITLNCTPGGTLSHDISIPSVPIAVDGSFASTSTESGVVNTTAATLTYTISGHFHGPSSTGVARVAGIVREDVTYNNGTSYSCSSNNRSWIAVRSGA